MNTLNNNRNFVPKGWGYEDWINNNNLYCGKILFLKKNKKLSYHYHKNKDETFFVYKGKITLFLIDEQYAEMQEDIEKNINWNAIFTSSNFKRIKLEEGDSIHIPVGTRHSLFGDLDSFIIEFSTFHEDSDSYRILKGD